MSADGNGSDGHSEPAWDSAISRAVELGYKVIEDQIRQGQRIAEELTRTSLGRGAGRNEGSDATGDMLERIVHFYSDIGSMWFDLLESLARNPAVTDIVGKGVAASNGNGRASDGAHHDIQLQIIGPADVRGQIALELHRNVDGAPLAVGELVSGAERIAGVEFQAAEPGWPAMIRVPVAADQPPGIYSGIVVDAATNEPFGTLCLRIPERQADPES